LTSRGVSTVERTLWVSATLVVVLASGCKYTSRQEAADGVTVQDDRVDGTPAAVEQADDDSQAGTAVHKPAPVTVEIVQMERKSKHELPLDQDRLSACLSQGAGRTTLTVVGERSRYDLQLRLVSEGQAQEWSGDLWRCELRSADPEVPFVWAVWSEKPMWMFRLVTSPGPVSYAAWVERSMLHFEEIAASRDADTALAAHFSPPDASAVMRVSFHSRKEWGDTFIGVRGDVLEITAQSIARDDTGQWTVKVTGPNSRKVYTVVSADGITWERK